LIPDSNPGDLDILLEITDLVCDARTVMANSYALGYFLTNPAKINYFEFQQGELEGRLDMLDEATEKPIDEFLVHPPDGKMMLNQEYWEHRTHLIGLYDVVKDNYERIMKDAEEGFPAVNDSAYDAEQELNEEMLAMHDLENKNARWNCSACTLSNSPENTQCEACHTARPTFN
jgi:hypothetical protein